MILLKLLSLNSEVITPLRCMRLFTYQSCGFMPAANSLRHCYIGFAQFPGNPQGGRWSIGPWKGRVTRSSSMWNKILIDISCGLSWLWQGVPCHACPQPTEVLESFPTCTGKTRPRAAAGTDLHSLASGHSQCFPRSRACQFHHTNGFRI